MATKPKLGRPRKKAAEKARATAVTLPPDVLRDLERRRKKEGLTRSAAVTAALREWLAG